MLSGVTLEKKPYLCSCNTNDLIEAMSRLNRVSGSDLERIFAPYQDSSPALVTKSLQAENVIVHLTEVKDIEQVFIDHDVIKAFSQDSLTTYLAVLTGNGYELYRSLSESQYMW